MAGVKPTTPEMVPKFARKLTKQLGAIFDSVPANKKIIITPLIDQFAFMTGSLYVLQQQIVQDGFVEDYQNGERQSGKKKSAACDAYMSMVKNYVSVVKQLVEEVPDKSAGEELQEFLNEFKA